MSQSIPVNIELLSIMDEERIEQRYQGELIRRGDTNYLRYTEKDEEGEEIRTVVKLAEREIKITRRGQVESEQLFVLHERKKGQYRTKMGRLWIETDTLTMDMKLEDGLGEVAWSYSLYVADEPAGLFQITLNIREG